MNSKLIYQIFFKESEKEIEKVNGSEKLTFFIRTERFVFVPWVYNDTIIIIITITTIKS